MLELDVEAAREAVRPRRVSAVPDFSRNVGRGDDPAAAAHRTYRSGMEVERLCEGQILDLKVDRDFGLRRLSRDVIIGLQPRFLPGRPTGDGAGALGDRLDLHPSVASAALPAGHRRAHVD
ncbi:unnamed protein product, partial [Phaeothamnion confervicola]